MPRCVLKFAGNGNAGRMDSQGGNLYPRYGMRPFSQRAVVRQNVELDTQVVRLKTESRNQGQPSSASASLLHRR